MTGERARPEWEGRKEVQWVLQIRWAGTEDRLRSRLPARAGSLPCLVPEVLRFMECAGCIRTPKGQVLPERSKDSTYIHLMKLRGDRKGSTFAAAAQNQYAVLIDAIGQKDFI